MQTPEDIRGDWLVKEGNVQKMGKNYVGVLEPKRFLLELGSTSCPRKVAGRHEENDSDKDLIRFDFFRL